LQQLGYTGRYYPVNARSDRVQNMQAYPNVSSLPETPEMVVIAIPRDGIPDVIDECAQLGVKAAAILADGFVERDQHGAEMQARISATARASGLLVVGPNCFGMVSVVNRCAAFYVPPPTWPGNVALISHSGGLLLEMTRASAARGFGYSHQVSAGNEAGVTAADYIDYFVADPSTDVILGIIESIRDPEGFVAACSRALEAGKPIALLKVGLSQKGAEAAATHTGAMAGSAAAHQALFRQKGIIQVSDLDELIDMGAMFSSAVGPVRARRMERAAVMEISGGAKDLVCDVAEAAGLELPELSEAGAAKLQAVLSPGFHATNPVDLGGSWSDADKKDVYPVCLDVFASEPGIDIVITDSLSRVGEVPERGDRLADLYAARKAHPDRFFGVLSRTSDQVSDSWAQEIRDGELAFLHGYGRGIRALGRLAEYSRALHGDGAVVETREDSAQGRQTASGQPVSGRMLDETESKQILSGAGIPTVETVLASSADDAAREARRMGYPVALKVTAAEIVHKSDEGGVLLGLKDEEAVRRGFAALKDVAAEARATFQGVTVQPMAAPGLEIILGAHRDPQFGPLIVFGLGGVLVEALNDVALRVAPLSPRDARAMLSEIKARRLLDEFRGRPAIDRAAIEQALIQLGQLMLSRPDIASIDVNPAFAYPEGLLAVDARIQLTADH
jgi:acyl-CoA synthetase (NDP forming)